VIENAHVNQGLTWSNIAWAFKTTSEDNWHPLTWISHMADVQIFGLKPAGHHLVNLLWHTLNVLLLFLLLRKATGYIVRSAIVAALFALHPLNVESVAWIAERKSLISTAFLFLALFAYGWYARRPGIGRYLTVVLLYGLGLIAKPMIITLPFLLLVADYWPLERLGVPGMNPPGEAPFGRNFLKLLAEKIPLVLMSIGSAVITVYAQSVGGALGSTVLLPFKWRVRNAIYSYLAYILKGFWPSRLAVFYPHPEGGLATWKVAAAALIIIAISAAVWRYREKRYLLTGWLWYLVALVPVIGIVQVGRQAMADRYAYLPLIGLFVMVVWLTADFAVQAPSLRPALAGVTLIALSFYAYISYIQIGYWQTSYTLFTHALEVTSRNGIAEDNLGVALLNGGRADLALGHFEAAVADMPTFSTAHYDLGTVLQKQGRPDEAVRQYRLALDYTGDAVEASRAHNNLGALFLQRNDLPAALTEYNAALKIDPSEGHSLLGRGTVEYRQGNLYAAHEDLSRAVQVLPGPLTYFALGRVLEDEGDLKSAANLYEDALKVAPDMPETQTQLNEVLQKLRQ
jgi:tetratricopeptide (TPR) repeat protein